MVNPSSSQRWRLILGPDPAAPESTPSDAAASSEETSQEATPALSEDLQRIDQVLESLYGSRKGSDYASAPYAVRWLGDVRKYFPDAVGQMLQQEAWQRFSWKALLQTPEFLESMTPNVALVSLLVSLKHLLPTRTKATAEAVVRRVVEDLRERWELPLQQALSGRASRRPKPTRPRSVAQIDWHRTIRKNLKYYQPEYRTIIPEQIVGWAANDRRHYHIILCVDQSGSMQQSVVHAGILGSVLATLPSLRTHLILFDTDVVDMTDQLDDPVGLLFGVQMGGGTHIAKALRYAQDLIEEPHQTLLFLITDLHEGVSPQQFLEQMALLLERNVLPVVLLALDDSGGRPAHNTQLAHTLTRMGISVAACTPDAFPELFLEKIMCR